ncbi:MAG: hypothetical protein QXF26_02295 [Candidatus Bathyarchaeia archaeon]
MLKYYAEFAPLNKSEDKLPYKLDIRGVALTTDVNKNNWKIDQSALSEVAKQLIGKTLRINHSSSVSDVIGRIKDSQVDGDKVVFEAEIIGSDHITSAVKEKIINNLINRVSIGLDAFEIYCSTCGKPTREGDKIIHDPSKHGGVEIIKNFDVKELSIVLDPAYEESKFSIAASFTAAMEKLFTVTPPQTEADVTNEPQPEKAGDEKTQEGGRMSVVTAPDSGQRDSLSLQDLIKYLESIKVSAEDIARKFSDVDARLKKLEEAEEARRKADEAEEARRRAEDVEQAGRKADEAEEAKDEEDEEEEVNKRKMDAQSVLAMSRTTAKTVDVGIPKWASEIIDSMRRVLG